MKPKSVTIYANFFKNIKDIKDCGSPAENFIRAIKLEGITPESNLSKALDFGCGEGRHAEYLAKMGYNVLATDVSEEAIHAAKRRLKPYNNVEFDLMDIDGKINSQDSTFDLILSWETMHWLGSKKSFLFYLDEFKRTLKKGGYIIITMPTETHFLKSNSIEIGESQYLCEADERKDAIFYSPNLYTLKKIFSNDYGFNIKRIMNYSHGRTDNPRFKTIGLDNPFSMYIFTLHLKNG